MTLTAAQYSQIGQGYEKAAGDPWVGAEKRVDLVNKAEWFRFLALRENQASREYNTAPASATFEGWARRSMSPFLTILWGPLYLCQENRNRHCWSRASS